ncbi:transporter [Oenococcus alcoholitolerans]|uniref:Transporter n=1 Tax=Oenococcus alcoholitolerans TaxID=931074 RepID=A0ABR4XSF7_9LACO|nr:transporter [Oenococcus alcoholitolerans]
MSKKNKWKIIDVILTALIGVVFGVVYFGVGLPWNLFTSLATPVALFLTGHSLASSLASSLVAAQVTNGATKGLFLMAGPLAAMIIKKPGSALFANLIASVVEIAIGSAWGTMDIIWGLVQGLGMELGFLLVAYKKPVIGLWLSTLTGTIISFAFQYFQRSYGRFDQTYVVILFFIWLISIMLFSGLLNLIIYKLLKKSKVDKITVIKFF